MDAIIFDMDGVIVDSERHWQELEAELLPSLVPTWQPSDLRKILGMSMDDIYRFLVEEHHFSQPKQQFLALYQQLEIDIYEHRAALIEGVAEAFVTLRDAGLPLAIASSGGKQRIARVLKRFGLQETFQEVVSADDVAGIGKPAPDIYLLTAQRLGVFPRQCLAIEDSRNGVHSAKDAGMVCIGLRNGFNEEQDLSQADLIVRQFADLTLPVLHQFFLDGGSSEE